MLNETISDPVARREARDQAIGWLDDATTEFRQTQEHARLARAELDRRILLCRLHGFTFSEIQEVTGMALGSISAAIRRAHNDEAQQYGIGA